MKNSKIEIIINCILPIIIGAFIYLCFRPKTILVFYWVNNTWLSDIITFLRNNLMIFHKHLPDWFINSLPDGLWAYSFIYSINLIWDEKKGWYWFWLINSCIIILLTEVLQFYKIMPGTFDVQDLVFLTLGMVVCRIIIKNKTNKYEKTF